MIFLKVAMTSGIILCLIQMLVSFLGSEYPDKNYTAAKYITFAWVIALVFTVVSFLMFLWL